MQGKQSVLQMTRVWQGMIGFLFDPNVATYDAMEWLVETYEDCALSPRLYEKNLITG